MRSPHWIFQSTLPVKGATAKIHNFTVLFLQNMYYKAQNSANEKDRIKFTLNFPLYYHKFWVRTPREIYGHFYFAPLLNHQYIFWKITNFTAEMFNLAFVLLSKVIKTKTVLLGVHYVTQLVLQTATLSTIQKTLKNRVLNTLTKIDTLLSNLSQPFFPSCILSVHIISNQNQHNITSKEMEDMHRYRLEDNAPKEDSAHKEQVPTKSSLPKKDGSAFLSFYPASI